jgi:hypothetical protein
MLAKARRAGRRSREPYVSGRLSERAWTIVNGAAVALIGLALTAVFTPVGSALSAGVESLIGVSDDNVEVTARPLLSPCDQPWALPKDRAHLLPEPGTPKSLELMNDSAAMRKWLVENDGAALGELSVDVLLAGSSQRVVTLLDVKIKVTGQRPAPPMEKLVVPCGGPGLFHWFHVPLDRLPVGRAVSLREIYDRWPQIAVPPTPDPQQDPIMSEQAESLQQLRLPIEISESDSETLRIVAEATGCDCRWTIELVWAVAGQEPRTRTVDFDGRPFRTAGGGAVGQ